MSTKASEREACVATTLLVVTKLILALRKRSATFTLCARESILELCAVHPLLSLRLPSPEVAVESLAVWRKSAHQPHRVATLFVVSFVNREGDTPVPPHRHAARTPHTSNALPEATLKERGKPLGCVAYSMFLRSVTPHRVRNLPPKFASSRPTRSRASKR